MKNGVDYHTAMDDLTEAEVFAYMTIFSEFEGRPFDWGAMQFVEPSGG